MEPLTMTVKEVQNLTGLNKTQCYKLMKEQGIPAKKIGKEYKILRSDFTEWFKKYMKDNN